MNNLLTQQTSLAVMQSQANKAGQISERFQALKNEDEFDAAAKDFEAMFVTEMMKPMFEGIKVDSTFGGGKGEEIFRGMMLQEYGKMMAETGQLGIAEHVKTELIAMQGSAQ